MDFNLSEKQAEMRVQAQELLGRMCSTELMRKAEQFKAGFDQELWDAGHKKLRWSGLTIPQGFGGQGASILDACIIFEEIGHSGATLPLVASTGLSGAILQNSPEGEQREQSLQAIASGKIISSALIDEQGRNEWDQPRLTAEVDSDGCVISGKKIMVPFASSADELLVSASESSGDVVLITVKANSSGVTITSHISGAGVPVSAVQFENVRVGANQVVAKGQAAKDAIEKGLHIGSLLATAEAIGLSERIKDITTEYVSNRVAFGQAIGAFQAVAHPCADMHINAETIRLLTHQAAWMVDNGKDATEEITSTKALANELFERTANDAFCVHGAEGFAEGCNLQLFMRRIRSFSQTMGETYESLERAAQSIDM